MKFSEKYGDAGPFQEPMKGIFVALDYSPCVVCKAPTRFLDYMTVQRPLAGVPICSEDCCAAQYGVAL